MPVGDAPRRGPVERDGAFAGVEHHEIVAKALHFAERNHAALYGVGAVFAIA